MTIRFLRVSINPVEMTLANAFLMLIQIPKGWRGLIFHEGPAHIYMSKAPDHGLETYLGDDADWFKIAQFYARNSTRWILDKPYVSDVSISKFNLCTL